MTGATSALSRSLRTYLDARSAAIVTARQSLRISETDAKALLYIVANPGTRPTNLRDYLGITSAGVTTLIDRLVERMIVRRDVDATDRRVNRITATIDMAEDPWSALSRFDDDFEVAVLDQNPTTTDEFARLLEDILAAAAEAKR
ncbi:MarR family transcriptional regulator [Planococcus sp. APC 4015]|nr:MarR family transcriptional regulator [Planococcus sp. APC 4015]